jgi:hypothetical protein
MVKQGGSYKMNWKEMKRHCSVIPEFDNGNTIKPIFEMAFQRSPLLRTVNLQISRTFMLKL